MPNPRKGRSRGYNGQKGGAHQIAWHQDPIILDRIQMGRKPWMERKTPQECLDIINAQLVAKYPDELPVGIDTMYEDRKRAIELRKKEAVAAVDEHLEELNHLQAKAQTLLEGQKSGSQNVTGLVNAIASIVEKKAKLDGSLVERKNVQVAADVSVEGGENPLADISPLEFGQACGVMYQQSEEFRRGFEMQIGTKVRVIDADAISAPNPGENHTNGHKELPGDNVVDFVP